MDYSKYYSDSKYVYALPVRLWHWSMAAAIFVLMITGYFIGKPLHSITGDPTYLFYMGYVRMIHFISAYVLLVGFIMRVGYAFIGNKYSRELFIIPFWRKSWWVDMYRDIRWYLFLDRAPVVHMGHNPLAQVGMATFMLFLVLMICTGFGIYQEESEAFYLAPFRLVVDFAYSGLNGNTIDLHNWHRLGMKLVITFVMVHLYMVWREETMGKTTLISTMVSGYRQVHPGERG